MFSGLLDPLRRNIGLRLSLLYALIFSVSSVALLALAYRSEEHTSELHH